MISLLHTLPGRAAFVDLGAFSDNARFLLCCGLFKDQPYAREQITALCLQVTASHPAIFRINFNTYAVAVVLEGSVDRFDLD